MEYDNIVFFSKCYACNQRIIGYEAIRVSAVVATVSQGTDDKIKMIAYAHPRIPCELTAKDRLEKKINKNKKITLEGIVLKKID